MTLKHILGAEIVLLLVSISMTMSVDPDDFDEFITAVLLMELILHAVFGLAALLVWLAVS